jgi:TonB family protein
MPVRPTVLQAFAICALVLTSRLAIAQVPADRAKPCVPEKRAARDSQHVSSTEMFATLVPVGDPAAVPALYLATLLQEIQLLLEAPDTIAQVSSGQMSAWLHADGRLTNPQATDTLLSPEVVRALAIAIDSASRLGGIGPVFPQLGADSVALRLVVYYASQRSPLSVPLFRVAIRRPYFEFEVEKPALAERGNPAPKYPAHLRERGIHGEVLAQFVVDETGRAEMGTFKVLKASHEGFVKAVRAVVPRMRFIPAEIAGCKVRQVVQLPLGFWTER